MQPEQAVCMTSLVPVYLQWGARDISALGRIMTIYVQYEHSPKQHNKQSNPAGGPADATEECCLRLCHEDPERQPLQAEC